MKTREKQDMRRAVCMRKCEQTCAQSCVATHNRDVHCLRRKTFCGAPLQPMRLVLGEKRGGEGEGMHGDGNG